MINCLSRKSKKKRKHEREAEKCTNIDYSQVLFGLVFLVEPCTKLRMRLLLYQFCMTLLSEREVSQTKLMETKSHTKLRMRLH